MACVLRSGKETLNILVKKYKFIHIWENMFKKKKRNNDPVEASETRGTTALVYMYLQLRSSLYTGTVHVLCSVAGVHPAGLTADQGCRQVSTILS